MRLPDVLQAPDQRREFLRQVARESARTGDFDNVANALGYHPHDGQAMFHEARTYPRRVLCTGRRFGKTTAAAAEASYQLLRGEDNGRGATRTLIFAPVGELSERVFRMVRTWLCRQLGFRTERLYDTAQRRELVMPWGSGLVCRSAQGEESVLGEAFDLAVVDEAARVPPRVWESNVEPALADRNGAAIFLSSPTGPSWFTDLVRRGDDPAWPEWWAYTGASSENPTLSRRWLAERERTVSPEVWRREYLGDPWVSYAGNVYPEWSELVHVSPEAEWDRRYPLVVAFDYGTTEASPFVALACQWRDPGVLFVVNELVIAGRSTQECSRRLDTWWTEQGYPRNETAASVGDIAARDARLTMQAALAGRGILCRGYVETLKQEVAAGVELVRQLLREERLLVHPRCRVTREEFASYVWQPGAREGEPERGVKKTADHTMDALRYLVYRQCRPDRAPAPFRGRPAFGADRNGAAQRLFRQEVAQRNEEAAAREYELAAWKAERQAARGEQADPLPPAPPESDLVVVGAFASTPEAARAIRESILRRRGGLSWRDKP